MSVISSPSPTSSTLPIFGIRRILYATDFSKASQRSLPVVAAIARKYGAEVFVANIWFPRPYSTGTPEAPLTLKVEQFENALARTRKVSESPDLAGLHTQILVEEGGVVSEALAKVVQERNMDLVVVSTHGRTGWKRLVMGSVAESLVRNLACPVLSVGPKLSERFAFQFGVKRILFPTDFSEETRSVFPFFAALAAQNGCELLIAHVLPEDAGTKLETRQLAESLRKDLECVYSPYIRKPCKAEFVIDFGDPAQRILALAQSHEVDLIAMGVRNASEFVTHFRRTVTYRVVLESTCPVLTSRAS